MKGVFPFFPAVPAKTPFPTQQQMRGPAGTLPLQSSPSVASDSVQAGFQAERDGGDWRAWAGGGPCLFANSAVEVAAPASLSVVSGDSQVRAHAVQEGAPFYSSAGGVWASEGVIGEEALLDSEFLTSAPPGAGVQMRAPASEGKPFTPVCLTWDSYTDLLAAGSSCGRICLFDPEHASIFSCFPLFAPARGLERELQDLDSVNSILPTRAGLLGESCRRPALLAGPRGWCCVSWLCGERAFSDASSRAVLGARRMDACVQPSATTGCLWLAVEDSVCPSFRPPSAAVC